MRLAESIHPLLPPMRRASRSGRMYVGPCPFCADGGDDRFHVWLEADGRRPAERYWCRVCNRRGLLRSLGDGDGPAPKLPAAGPAPARPPAAPNPAHTPHYRELYRATALWAHAWMLDECHPDPRRYLRGRGLDDVTIGRYLLGVTLRDPQSLVDHLRAACPESFPFAEEAGLLARDSAGQLRAHWHLCGRIVFPYIAGGQVVDLRTRTYDRGKGYRSLGPYEPRGALAPFGWDSIRPGARTVIVAEAELKALAALQAFHAGDLAYPAIGQPGLTVFRERWAAELRALGVEEVVLCYDRQHAQPQDGLPGLTPEEQWALRNGAACETAGLQVRVARLPLAPDDDKAEIDTFLPREGAARFQQLIDAAPPLAEVHRAIGRSLLERHNLPPPDAYPLRRPRPTRLATSEARAAYTADTGQPAAQTIESIRNEIASQVEAHAAGGQGMLVLAHPPGMGKGHNATRGLARWLQTTPGADDKGFLVWTALRKNQLHDQAGLPLIPLHGRGPDNCRKLPEAIALAQKGYSVKDALCARRCPHVGHCGYLRQFDQEGDFFASTRLLSATGWWRRAGVVVLDEFDPASLARLVQLSVADLAAMSRAHPRAPAIQTVLRWVAQATATTTERAIAGALFLDELAHQAALERASLDDTLRLAIDQLPPPEQLNLLVGLPNGASLADYQALPPGHTATLLRQIASERELQRAGRRFTSRLEARGGRLELFLRVEHLVEQLAWPEQPKIILDATASPELLRALFPRAPLRFERPHLPGALRVVQVVGRDWAKSTLRDGGGARAERRQSRWFDEVARHIRPGRPTLVVCTAAWEEPLKTALAARGHSEVKVAHYGALRGSNAYRGHDVVLAQVYHPNLEQIVREGRALFADDPEPLDERVVEEARQLADATGATWRVSVPTFADPRLAALLAQRREAELLQCALRGRPLDHPDAQVTLLFSLPVPGLPPTVIAPAAQSPESNAGREAAVKARLCAAAQQLLDRRAGAIDVAALSAAAGVGVGAVRRHWAHIAARLRLAMRTGRQRVEMPKGGARVYERMVLVRRGRAVPAGATDASTGGDHEPGAGDGAQAATTDRAWRKGPVTRPIGRRRRAPLRLGRWLSLGLGPAGGRAAATYTPAADGHTQGPSP